MKIANNISWKKLQDKVVAVNLTTGTYYTMNAVASDIWKLLAEGRSKAEIADTLAADYEVDAATVLADVESQLAYWKRKNSLPRNKHALPTISTYHINPIVMNKKIYEKPETVRHESKNVVQGSLYTVTLHYTSLYSLHYTSLYYYH